MAFLTYNFSFSSQSYTVPSDVKQIYVLAVGGGGGSAGGTESVTKSGTVYNGGNNGSDGYIAFTRINVNSGETYTIGVGNGGNPGAANGNPGGSGNITSITGPGGSLNALGGAGGSGVSGVGTNGATRSKLTSSYDPYGRGAPGRFGNFSGIQGQPGVLYLSEIKVVYTSNNTYTVPDYCSQVYVIAVGGGGGAASGDVTSDKGGTTYRGGTNGGDGNITAQVVSVSPGQTYSVTIGQGSAGGVATSGQGTGGINDGTAGGTTTFSGTGGTVTATGGAGGTGNAGPGPNGSGIGKAASAYDPYGRGGQGVYGQNGGTGNNGAVYIFELKGLTGADPVKMSALRNIWGNLYSGTKNQTSDAMSEFYSVTQGVPASGPIKFSDFRNKDTKTKWFTSGNYTINSSGTTFQISRDVAGTVSVLQAIGYFSYGISCGLGGFPGWTSSGGYQQVTEVTSGINYSSTNSFGTNLNSANNLAETLPDLYFSWRKGCACGNDQFLTSYYTNIKASGFPNSPGIEFTFTIAEYAGQTGC